MSRRLTRSAAASATAQARSCRVSIVPLFLPAAGGAICPEAFQRAFLPLDEILRSTRKGTRPASETEHRRRWALRTQLVGQRLGRPRRGATLARRVCREAVGHIRRGQRLANLLGRGAIRRHRQPLRQSPPRRDAGVACGKLFTPAAHSLSGATRPSPMASMRPERHCRRTQQWRATRRG